jgi:glucose/arabinose dehydrogenase
VRRVRIALLAGAAALALAGCSSAGAAGGSPTWEPSPDFGTNGEGPGVQLSPIIPVPSQSQPAPGGRPNGGTGGSGAPSASPTGTTDPNVVATRLSAPVGLTMLPDNTALVGERTTGRIVRVQPKAGQPVPTVRTLSGLDTSGDGGLLDLAVSPTYDEDNLIYAYITTRTDNRVVDFTLHGPVTPVLTGIPKGKTGNTGRLAFGSDHDLYVGTGDAGHPAAARDRRSLAGKVLRVTDIGAPATGNPYRGSAVWTTGHHEVDGLCPVPDTTSIFEVEAGTAGTPTEVNVLARGANYGWPAAIGSARRPATTMPAVDTGPGGCAVQNGRIYVTSLDAKSLLGARLTGRGTGLSTGPFTTVLSGTYGRLKTVVAADDGALWLTTSNRDGQGKPVPDDERVIRYLPPQSGGGANPA